MLQQLLRSRQMRKKAKRWLALHDDIHAELAELDRDGRGYDEKNMSRHQRLFAARVREAALDVESVFPLEPRRIMKSFSNRISLEYSANQFGAYAHKILGEGWKIV